MICLWFRRGKKKHQKNNFVYVFNVYVLEMIFERFFYWLLMIYEKKNLMIPFDVFNDF